MNEVPVKSPHYAIIVDRKANDILTAMFAAAVGNSSMFREALRVRGISDQDLSTFIIDISDKEHALGWCIDPHCQFNGHKK